MVYSKLLLTSAIMIRKQSNTIPILKLRVLVTNIGLFSIKEKQEFRFFFFREIDMYDVFFFENNVSDTGYIYYICHVALL